MCLSPELQRRARISIALRLRNPALSSDQRAYLERLRGTGTSGRALDLGPGDRLPRRVERPDLGRPWWDDPQVLSQAAGAPYTPGDVARRVPSSEPPEDDERAWELFNAALFEQRRGAYDGDPWEIFERRRRAQ